MMYAPRATCAKCAAQVSFSRVQKQLVVAWFSSLAEDVAQSSTTGPSALAVTAAAENSQTGPSVTYGRDKTLRPRQYSPSYPTPKWNEKAALFLFNDVIAGGNYYKAVEKPVVREEMAARKYESIMLRPQVAAKLSELARMNSLGADRIHVKEAFLQLRDDIWPLLLKIETPLPGNIYKQASSFLMAFMARLIKRGYTGDTCNRTLSEMYGLLKKMDLSWRNGLVLNLCYPLLMENKPIRRAEVFRDLIDMWKHISQLKRYSQKGQELQFALPSPSEVVYDIERNLEDPRFSREPTTNALASLFLQFDLGNARMLVPSLLATITLLSDPTTPEELVLEAAPLLNLVNVALKKAPIDDYKLYIERDVYRLTTRFPSDKFNIVTEYMLEHWPRAQAMLSGQKLTLMRLAKEQRRKVLPRPLMTLSDFHRRLRQAYKSDNTGVINTIWNDFKSHLEDNVRLAEEMRNKDQFLDYWHFIWCALRRPAMLQQLQDLMKRYGIPPTVRTYTSMMHGWKQSHSIGEIQSLWDMLTKSKVKLDLPIWVERVSALVEEGLHREGIEAMAEMLDLWKKACAKGRPETAVQPDTEVVNAALPGLLKHDRAAANAVLEWAGQEGMAPNTATYNILLQESLKDTSKQPEQAIAQLFQAMRAANVEPDAATFTIMLEEALDGLQGRTAAQQVEAIDQVFQDIHDAGLEANQEMYGKVLYAVANLPQSSDVAIQAVQKHMRWSGWRITPHMVTTLLDRLMEEGPPVNGPAIAKLLQTHNYTSIIEGDQALWERVLSAYSQVGDAKRAWALYEKLRAAQRPPMQRSTNSEFLHMLIRFGMRDKARDVVELLVQKTDPDLEGRHFKDDKRYWRHQVWHIANRHGLLDMKTAPSWLKSALLSSPD